MGTTEMTAMATMRRELAEQISASLVLGEMTPNEIADVLRSLIALLEMRPDDAD